MPPTTEQAEIPTIRDARVDLIGFAGELWDNFAKQLNDAVKKKMAGKEAIIATADSFEGRLVTGESSEVDVEKFWKLFEDEKITKKEFLSALKVTRGAALKFLSPKKLDAISSKHATAPTLKITRKKGVEPTLAQALHAITEATK